MLNENLDTKMIKIQELAASRDAISEIVGELASAREEKRKPKIKEVYKEKSKQFLSSFRQEKIIGFAMVYVVLTGIYLSEIFDGILFKGDGIFLYIIAYFAVFTGMAVGFSELGYVRKITSEKTTDEEKTITYYLFGYVPEVKIIPLFSTITFLLSLASITKFLANEIIFNFTQNAIVVILLIVLPFFEFIFMRKNRG